MSLRLVTTAAMKQKDNYGWRFKNSKKSWHREGEMSGGDSKGPRQFMVCLTTLQLVFYSDTCFILFDHCVIWSSAYVVTTDVLMVTGNYGLFVLNTSVFKH
jgi:hypothetical protein